MRHLLSLELVYMLRSEAGRSCFNLCRGRFEHLALSRGRRRDQSYSQPIKLAGREQCARVGLLYITWYTSESQRPVIANDIITVLRDIGFQSTGYFPFSYISLEVGQLHVTSLNSDSDHGLTDSNSALIIGKLLSC